MCINLLYIGGIDADDGEVLSVSNCLSFFTGTNKIPPTGFNSEYTLNFNFFPTASMCALILTLSTLYYDCYTTFKQKMLYAFCNNGGFGLYYSLLHWSMIHSSI